ncbi:MAG: orotidine-5'-phosphate decarboxylase [Bacteroidia bacterium]|nr:orotidine-5'-phosphate decarboxylase [Bacteroidia bacterium]
MTREELAGNIRRKGSFLCVGLDTDPGKIPSHLLKEDDPVFEFNRLIVDTVHDLAVAVKPNLAFYESMGMKGWMSLVKTFDYIRANYPDMFLIADAKRCDIGNTANMYARTFFDKKSSGFDFDAVTVSPYMGEDSISPFLSWPGKWVIILALTSNKGAADFQFMQEKNGERLFERVLRLSSAWGNEGNIMFVAGATQASLFKDIRRILPYHFLLVPGVGEQGGSLAEVAENGMNKDVGLLVNVSRSIIYADDSENFTAFVRQKAEEIRNEMNRFLK